MISPTFISTASLTDETRLSIARIQAQLADAQKELATGRHADVGVSLGANTGITVSMRQDRNQIQSIKDTNSVVLTRLQASQAALQAHADAAGNSSPRPATSPSSPCNRAMRIARCRASTARSADRGSADTSG